MDVPVSVLTALDVRREQTWTAFYGGYTAGTDAAGLSLTYLANLYHGFDAGQVLDELNALLHDTHNLAAFTPILLILHTETFNDGEFFWLPYVGGDDADSHLDYNIRRVLETGETSRYGMDALNEFCRLLSPEVGVAYWDSIPEAEMLTQIHDYPFERVAAIIGIFMRNCINRQTVTQVPA